MKGNVMKISIEKEEDVISLIQAYDEYITLLGKELHDLGGFAFIHGWKSKRCQEGIDAREKIDNAKKKLKIL